MKKVIQDFDNTIGVPGCDIDDMLALLYLLGSPDEVEVAAVCTCAGNSDVDTVDAATDRIFSDLGLSIPVYHGTRNLEDRASEAASFLAKALSSEPATYNLLMTGSMTNLLGAEEVHPGVLAQAASIDAMGGITESLVFNGVIMNELNLSCDPDASIAMLDSGTKVSIATSQNCLPAFFEPEEIDSVFAGTLLEGHCARWLDHLSRRYGLEGFHCWDVVAAVHLLHPEFFEEVTADVVLDRRMLTIGFLEPAFEGAPQARVIFPRIIDAQAFKREVLDTWRRALERLGVHDGR